MFEYTHNNNEKKNRELMIKNRHERTSPNTRKIKNPNDIYIYEFISSSGEEKKRDFIFLNQTTELLLNEPSALTAPALKINWW